MASGMEHHWNASSKVTSWNVLDCIGWDVLGCFGMLWNGLRIININLPSLLWTDRNFRFVHVLPTSLFVM